MKRTLLYIFPILLLVGACVSEDPSAPSPGPGVSGSSSCRMGFSLGTASFESFPETRADVDIVYDPDAEVTTRYGWYKKTTYPGDEFFLTSFHRDSTDLYQYYFQDLIMDDASATPSARTEWDATDWFWPIQGKMEFLSYWSPNVYGFTKFDTIQHADRSISAHLKVETQGGSFSYDGHTYNVPGLDGYTDFLYIAEKGVNCPQPERYPLLYRHGLAWLTLSLQAEVKTDGVYDEAKTNELINHVQVQKIVIEDCARKGQANIVPGEKVAWIISPQHILDQVYTRPANQSSIRGHYGYFDWNEETDASTVRPSDYITLSHTEQYLGLYRPKDENQCTGNGLLLIPQHKTAITVYYLVKNGKAVTGPDGTVKHEDLEVAQKFELHDNDLEWEAGKLYHYDILFKSDATALHSNIQLTETTYELAINLENKHFDADAFGQVKLSSNTYSEPVFILDPYHTQGSPFEDEMDYLWGGKIF